MKIKKYVLEWHDSEKNTGGIKAKQDVITFLKKDGFEPVKVPATKIGKVWASLLSKIILGRLEKGVILIQYPSGKPFLRKKWLYAACKNKKLKVIVLIHDLESIRFYNDIKYSGKRKKEFDFLNRADGLIALNNKMKTLLKNDGVDIPIVSLEAWDYENQYPLINRQNYNGDLCYAGNLKKSSFLSKLRSRTVIRVFGPNPEMSFPKSVKYMGQSSPQELPSHLNADFGLVWDGTSVETCEGMYGQYLKYNDPHKFSLYISSGLPVIVWEHAAIADFVRANNIGLTIDSLTNIDSLISSISQTKYMELQSNVKKIAFQMRKGHYLITAVNSLILKLSKMNIK